jgi:selenocysteine-specific elongation factor
MPQRPVILGTAGHIDHGKTALVRALTGIDTDRLKEEQRRGITIELGFAHLTLGDTLFGVVDVPGHERFIKSMVAGAAGIDIVALVVAADEGVMPQTREHLDICGLLGVRHGLVALTKVDLVDDDWLSLVTDDLRAFLAGTFLEGAPVVPCSAQNGAGLDDLRRALLDLAARVQPRDPDGLLRLPLDRVFTMKGFGTIVTGTLHSGTVRVSDDVVVLPGVISAKVRGIQVHGESMELAVAGQRTAVNLGGVDRHAVARGEVLVHGGTFAPSSMIDVVVRLLPGARPLSARSKVLFHLGTRQQEAACVLLDTPRLEAGGAAIAQLRFELPVVALPGDRFILRGFAKLESYGTTVGGGEVVRVLGRKVRPRDAAAVELLQRMRSAEPRERIALEVLAAGPPGLTRLELQQRLPMVPGEIDRLLGELLARRVVVRYDRDSGAVVHGDHFAALRARLGELVDRFHRDRPLEPGIAREELRSRVGQGIGPRLFFALLQALEAAGELVVERESCRRPGHTIQAAGQSLRPVAQQLRAIYERAGLGPPRDAGLAAELRVEPATIASALKLLVDEGVLVRVTDLYFARVALDALRDRLVAYLTQNAEITPSQFKDLVGQSRKFVIPLAEHFDAQKVTLRVGDLRKLRR